MASDYGVLAVEISKNILDRTEEICLVLKGNCMRPIIRDRDEVTIRKIPYRELSFGDVAIFQTTASTLHANTLFRNLHQKERENPPANYVGKIVQIKRSGRVYEMNRRSLWTRLWQTALSPANPYGWGLPKTLWKKAARRKRSE